MAELDLPTVHLQRYFELVARRRHALVPFAVVGAIIGGIVAFLIPRYYEAYTIVRLSGHVLEEDQRTNNPAIDPFVREIEAAREKFQDEGFVGEAIEHITNEAWTDHMPVGGKLGRVHPKVVQAAKRVVFRDYNQQRGRTTARIFIAYRDTDPKRASDLTNSLRETFLEKEKDRVLSNARRDLDFARDAKDRQERICDEKEGLLRAFERNQNVPSVSTGTNPWAKNPWDAIYDECSLADNEVAQLEAQLEGNKAKIAGIEEQMRQGLIPEQIPASAAAMDPAIAGMLAQMNQRLLAYEETAQRLTERHAQLPLLKVQIARLRDEIERLKRSGGVDETGQQPNPRYADKKRELNDLAVEQKRLAAELEVKRKRATELAKFKERLPELRKQHGALKSELDDAIKTRDELRTRHARMELQHAQLQSMGQFWEVERPAFAPDEATYPQIWLIAAAGMIAGMIAAFVLLIVADFFQNTFKSVDEVQRGLPVPILGVGGFMESEAERRLLRRRRIAVSLSSVAALVLVSGVVGMYFWNKLQLPTFVASMLDKVFGK